LLRHSPNHAPDDRAAFYVTLSANDLPVLAERLHAEYSEALILITADNDENGTGQLR